MNFSALQNLFIMNVLAPYYYDDHDYYLRRYNSGVPF